MLDSLVEVLSEPNISNAGSIVPQQVNMRVHDHGVHSLAVLAHH